jgi:hypothetical protein
MHRIGQDIGVCNHEDVPVASSKAGSIHQLCPIWGCLACSTPFAAILHFSSAIIGNIVADQDLQPIAWKVQMERVFKFLLDDHFFMNVGMTAVTEGVTAFCSRDAEKTSPSAQSTPVTHIDIGEQQNREEKVTKKISERKVIIKRLWQIICNADLNKIVT